MRYCLSLVFVALAATAPTALAQKWEVGVGAGGSFLTSETITNPVGDADATRNLGSALSAWLDNNIGSGLFGGELRYDHENGDLKLSSNGTTVKFASQSNALHYDVVFNFTPSESAVRPFIEGGAGVIGTRVAAPRERINRSRTSRCSAMSGTGEFWCPWVPA